jgi:hypothetical protein
MDCREPPCRACISGRRKKTSSPAALASVLASTSRSEPWCACCIRPVIASLSSGIAVRPERGRRRRRVRRHPSQPVLARTSVTWPAHSPGPAAPIGAHRSARFPQVFGG